ncbi:MAG: choline dehydrogenase [Acidobacteriota bacterium]|jgi:choline dehydrogenase|nr:choline dehydrogenase [Acidobacteriota bacterium]
MSAEEYEYIVVGSGAGGGPLAANLAKSGCRVLLIEAGSDPESYLYQVPCFHAYSSEEKAMSWDYFVHHYTKDEERDPKYRADRGGVFYPRAGTLGGCTAHNAMITMYPHDDDWNGIAELTGDVSWRAESMRQYFQRLEKCTYADPAEAAKNGHGYSGWLSTSTVDPLIALGDKQVIQTVMDAALRGGCAGILERIFSKRKIEFDPNDKRNTGAEGLTSRIPLATANGRRNGTREYIRRVMKEHPDKLDVRMNHLATRVIFDGDRAVGVECLTGEHLYQADPDFSATATPATVEYRCTREVILAGGAFNTPQLLMLSGIGPKAHLEEMGIACRADRAGVGRNMQDRYEVAVVGTTYENFEVLRNATFKAPAADEEGDECFQEWLKGVGMYTSNGALIALITRSKSSRPDPDLFMFALPGNFHGYYPGYSADVERQKNYLTWAILKAHTNNTNGEVRLASSDPRARPYINFHYFDESNDTGGEDLDSVVNAVLLVRQMNARNESLHEELIPGPGVKTDRKEIAKWVADNAWGHHASCSCRMGRADDPMAVVDSRFRVIGARNLRVVDASVFPRIPGFFIVTPIYMISEKATDAILADRARPA